MQTGKRVASAAAMAVCGALFALAHTAVSAQRGDTPPGKPDSPAVEAWIRVANMVAGTDLNNSMTQYLCSNTATKGALLNRWFGTGDARDRSVHVVKAFDNLYYIAKGNVASWALVTSGGIIQFDALNNSDEAENVIVAGYRQMGLDPAQLKYVVVMHAHGDHYGGAKYLQDTYKARVLMGGPDWDVLARAAQAPANGRGPGVPPPTRDISVLDGQKLTLGDTTVTLYLTPGHTPGSLSALIPVKDRGQPHLMSEWGGTDFLNPSLEPTATSVGLLQHIASLQRFANAGIAAGADGILSNHQVFDSSLNVGETIGKATLLQNRKAGDSNPWVIGRDAFVRVMAIHDACMEAARTRVQEGYR